MRLLALLAFCCVAGQAADRAETGVLFLRNRGQAPHSVRAIAKARGVSAWFLPGSVLLRAHGSQLRVEFEGSRGSEPEAAGRRPGAVNFLTGSRGNWLLDQPLYARVSYRALYPGIDMTYSSEGVDLKSEFAIQPGADPSPIRLRYTGTGPPRLRDDGSLEIPAGERVFREAAPAAYQMVARRTVRVAASFTLEGSCVGFQLGPYDRSLPLVIDPVMAFSTLLGGAGADAANAVAVDAAGNAYIAGFTEAANFPTSSPYQSFNAGGDDVFVAKFAPGGSTLLYCTYIGGAGDDRATGIAVDSTGAAYVTGFTVSANFPTRNAFQRTLAGSRNAFVLKLAPTGNTLVYSTYLGGNNADSAYGIALDSSLCAYVAGDATSSNFPASGFQTSIQGGADVFVTKLAADGASLAYSTYLGGSSNDHGASIAVDASGAAWVAGSTWSADFPTAHPIQRYLAGGQDAFVAHLSANGASLLFSTYLGGSAGSVAYPEAAQSVALDGLGNAYIAGVASSADFPTAHAFQSALHGSEDAFVAEVTSAGTLAYSSYLGGSGVEVANAIAVDAGGSAYVAGYTYSLDLPVSGALQGSNAGGSDAFLARVGGTGALDYLSYLGGSGLDTATSAAIGPGGAVLVAGWTLSGNFPLANAYQTADSGGYAAFLAKFTFPAVPVNLQASPNSGRSLQQIFTFQFADALGASDLSTVAVLFNATASTAGACSVTYDRAANTLALLTDAGALPSSTIKPGSGSQMNSQCVLNGAASSASASGGILTLVLSLTFQNGMSGSQNIYMRSVGSSGAVGWDLKGTWTVPPTAQVQLPNGSALTTYVGQTQYIDFSSVATGAKVSTIGDSALTVTFDTPMTKDIAGPLMEDSWTWNIWPASQLQSTATLVPVLVSGNIWPGPYTPSVTLHLSTPASTFGFEISPADSRDALITATFYSSETDATGSVVQLDHVSWLDVPSCDGKECLGGSQLIAATGGTIKKVTINVTPHDMSPAVDTFGIAAIRYALPVAGSVTQTTPASISSPANGATLSGASVTFQWNAAAGASSYWLSASKTTAGGTDLYSADAGSATSATVTGLPTNGGPVYVRLSTKFGSVWRYADFQYVTATAAAVTTPTPVSGSAGIFYPVNGATLPGSTVTFRWSAVAGASEYWLYLSQTSAGGKDLFSGTAGTNTSDTLMNLPAGGGTIYVRLWTRTGATWQYLDYAYKPAAKS